MCVFWRKGFEAASLTDLCQATGLHKGSIYQAFGDKHQLFMRALNHYSEKEFNEVLAVVSHDVSPLTNIYAVVEKICSIADDGRGCLMVNTMVEMSNHDPIVLRAIQEFGQKRINAMSEMIAAAQQAGEIRQALDPKLLSIQMMMTLAGAAAMTKGFLDREQTYQAILSLIGYWR